METLKRTISSIKTHLPYPGRRKPEMPTVRIAIVQMNSTSDSPLELASQVEARLGELPGEVSLVILPELWTVSRFDGTLPGKADFSPAILDRLSS
jgi:hypothetical protein